MDNGHETPSTSSLSNGANSDNGSGEFNLADAIYGPVPEVDFEYADFSLGRAGLIGLRRNITIIVAAIFIREENKKLQALLVQEAKSACRGSWYMPAGRLEMGETLEEGTKREVKEEAGIDCVVEDLILAEVQGCGWYRFTFLCDYTGGDLKTTQQADAESMQAQWFDIDEIIDNKCFNLRSKDCRRLVDTARTHFLKNEKNPTGRCRPAILPTIGISPGMFVRFLIVDIKANETTRVLLSKDLVAGTSDLSLPIVEFPLTTLYPAVITSFFKQLFTDASVLEKPSTCLGVHCEMAPKNRHGHDGVCITLLSKVKSRHRPQLVHQERYQWHNVADPVQLQQLKQTMEHGPQFRML